MKIGQRLLAAKHEEATKAKNALADNKKSAES
jgi:hypothetical protein